VLAVVALLAYALDARAELRIGLPPTLVASEAGTGGSHHGDDDVPRDGDEKNRTLTEAMLR